MPLASDSKPIRNPEFIAALRDVIRGDVLDGPLAQGLYATDASHYQIVPSAVVVPRDAEDVQAALRIAREYCVPITSRGAGTSLAGQTVGNGLILDFSKWMNRILEVNVEERWARVEPGLVRDELNAAVAAHRLHLAPDPATASRANIGGMIGNNSSGTRSIIYGKTVDHVLGLKVLLASGEVVEFGPTTPAEYAEHATRPGREGELYGRFQQIVETNRAAIEKAYPKVMRRVGGYNLDEFTHTDSWNLAKLITGSESTLAIILEAKVNLEPLPKHTGMVVAHFDDLLPAVRAVAPALKHGPSAVELLDYMAIDLARVNLGTSPLVSFMEGHPRAVLLIEFYGDTAEEVDTKTQRLADDLRARGMGYACPRMLDATSIGHVWGFRKASFGLMMGIKGNRRPASFIEDAAVPGEVLPEYIEKVIRICRETETPVTMYAHASVGLIHVQPLLDLRDAADIERMRVIAARTFELVKHYGGSWSGEHGDGLVRSPFLREFFGEEVYGALKQVKELFDPDYLLNPGKIIDSPPMDENLRYGTEYVTPRPDTWFHFRTDGDFAGAVHMCTGIGECRKTLGGTMCPSYMATRNEVDSTRGRANTLRMAMSGQLDRLGLTSPRVGEALDLCLSCKACKAECPSNVDMARLKSEWQQHWHDRHGLTLRDRLVGGAPAMAARFSGRLAPLANFAQHNWLMRQALEKLAGLDARRRAPAYARNPFPQWFARRNGTDAHAGRRQVVLFDDTYMNHHEPNIGQSAVRVLEACGYEVLLARAGCCQRPRISHGLLREAKRDGTRTMENLDRFVQAGLPIVVCEPSCASALTDDLPDLMDDAELGRRVASGVMMIDQFLARELGAGRINKTFGAVSERILLHGHCHQKSLYGTAPMKHVWSAVPGLEVREVDSGCCGMAGSFGYEREHYELSQTIGERKLLPAIRERAAGEAVVACGFSCRHQIADATGVKALHWIETLEVN